MQRILLLLKLFRFVSDAFEDKEISGDEVQELIEIIDVYNNLK